MNKKIMILGANDLLVPLIQKSKQLGCFTIVASPNVNEPGFKYADEKVIVDLRNKELVLSHAEKLQIDGIITDQAETPIRTVAFVADKLGLPGIGNDKAELFTNKYLQRKKCAELGLSNIKFHLTQDCIDAVAFFKELRTNAIMKPIDSAGSRGVIKVFNENDIIKSFEYTKAVSKTNQVIIEEFIEGKEILLDGVCCDGKYQTIICGEYNTGKNLFSSFLTKWPANLTEAQKEQINLFTKNLIEGFGLSWGRTHTELKLNNNEIWLMETAARGGGRYISSTTVQTMTDFSSEEFLIKKCLGENISVPIIHFKKNYCAYVAMFLPKGKIVSIEGLDEVLSQSFVSANNFDTIKIGDYTNDYCDKTESKFIHFYANNEEDFNKRLSFIRSTLKICVETSDGYKGIDWGI